MVAVREEGADEEDKRKVLTRSCEEEGGAGE